MMAGLKRWVKAVPGAVAVHGFVRDRLLADHFRRRRFAATYTSNYWRGEESRSGRGSGLEQTAAIRAAIPALCRELGVRSILDVPCGDFHWMRLVDLSGIAYTGADIVPALIADNNARHGGAERRFQVLDIVATPPDRADLVLCRDLLVHLPYRDIRRAIENVRRSGATWLLTTTFRERADNAELSGTDWRPLNFQHPPFGFPPPHRLIDEQCTEDGGRYRDKSLGLWRVADLPAEALARTGG